MRTAPFLILLLVLCSCATPSRTGSPIPSQTRIENLILSPDLSRSIEPVSFSTSRTPGGLVEIQAQLANRGRRARTIRYQASWFDGEGRPLGRPVWSSRLVQPRETFEIRIIAPHSEAASGRLHIDG